MVTDVTEKRIVLCDGNFAKNCYKYDQNADSWEKIGQRLRAAANYGWDFHPNVGLVTAGGYCEGSCFLNEVERSLDSGMTWSDLPAMPKKTTFPCMTIIDEKTIVVTGGEYRDDPAPGEPAPGETLHNIFIFDFDTMEWRSGPDMPTARANHGCHVITDGQG